MDATALLIRFLVGLILAGAIAIWGGVPLMAGLSMAVAVAIAVAIRGDGFSLWLMKACR